MLWGGDEGCGTHRCCMDPPMERPMKRNDLSRSLVAFDQASRRLAVVELIFRSWLVAGLVPGLTRQPLKKLGPDAQALLCPQQRCESRHSGIAALGPIAAVNRV